MYRFSEHLVAFPKISNIDGTGVTGFSHGEKRLFVFQIIRRIFTGSLDIFDPDQCQFQG